MNQQMAGTVAGNSPSLSDTQQFTRDTGSLITRKLWLPKFLYDLIPYFYLTSGFAALFATLYISEWFWILPHYLLFSVACMQLGLSVLRRRRRPQKESEMPDSS